MKLPELAMFRTAKREPVNIQSSNGAAAAAGARNNNNNSSVDEDHTIGRRVLRSHYLNFKSRISDERDNISQVDSDKFKTIIEEVERLHQQGIGSSFMFLVH